MKKEKEANNILMTAKSIIISDRQKIDINIEQQVILVVEECGYMCLVFHYKKFRGYSRRWNKNIDKQTTV
jgi:hypothetical protein